MCWKTFLSLELVLGLQPFLVGPWRGSWAGNDGAAQGATMTEAFCEGRHANKHRQASRQRHALRLENVLWKTINDSGIGLRPGVFWVRSCGSADMARALTCW